MKRATNLSVDAALLDAAKALRINLSQTFEDGLRRELALRQAAAWREENGPALQGYNDWVAEHGLPLDRYRTF